MATLSGFRSAFPECNATAPTLQVKLAIRDTKTNADAWGSDTDTVIYLSIAATYPPTDRHRRRYLARLDALSMARQATRDGVTEERMDLIQDALDAAEVAADAAQADATQALSDASDAQADADALDTRLDTAEATLDDHETRIAVLEP